jgi:hypothetical protein
MPSGVSGSLLTTAFIARHVKAHGSSGGIEQAAHSVARWWAEADRRCGPAASIRTIVDLVGTPLASMLGFTLLDPRRLSDAMWAATFVGDGMRLPILVISWGAPPESACPAGQRLALAAGADWWLALNGPIVRIVDSRRHAPTRHLDISLSSAADDDSTAWLLLWLLRGLPPSDDPHHDLASMVAASDREAHAVCSALRTGVREALEHLLNGLIPPRRRSDPELVRETYDEAQTAIYRMLFLLFAEARSLVPMWHPIYREAYTIEKLRELADRGTTPDALWPAFQAIWRLAYQGCEAGDLKVTAFNGRLFAPDRTRRLASTTVSASSVREATLALSTASVRTRSSRERIAYGDLGVEELGTIYEALLEFDPVLRDDVVPRRARHSAVLRLERTATDRRKQTGTFYTPHQITRYVVSRALAPLVRCESPERILTLRILDPAMGSGAFLVAACRYLAGAYEQALINTGHCLAADVTEDDRAGFRRLVAQRCLYGVDANPAAVQLARLSLWLTTLAADRPLGFLDHHIMTGNSLIGVSSWSDLVWRRPSRSRTSVPSAQLSLFSPDEWQGALQMWLPIRRDLAHRDDRAASDVHWKEAQLGALTSREDRQRWRRLCDLWCSQWTERGGRTAEFIALAAHIVRGESDLPGAVAAAALERVEAAAVRHAFFHWPLEFPEVFSDESAQGRGFDAVIGNPPWEMLRADETRRDEDGTTCAVRFSRGSGQYSAQSDGHANAYQLFVERAIRLARIGGRFGLVVPHGLASDHGAAPLRQLLLRTCATDTLVGIENRAGVFPIHRGVRFLLATGTAAAASSVIRCRFGVRDPNTLERLEHDPVHDAFPITLTPALLERLSGPGLQIPDLRSSIDLQIAERAVAAHPALASAEGWGVTFGRELNATDNRPSFTRSPAGLPVFEGKHITPFRVAIDDVELRIGEAEAARLLGSRATFGRPRLAFRDVTSTTNRLTLIAAIIPARAVTTHTLFCLRTPLRVADQWLLCALLNSFVANFLVRQRVSSHVTLSTMERLPVPRPAGGSPLARELGARARWLATARSTTSDVHAHLQALAARAYGLSNAELGHVLSTFPLVPVNERDAVLRIFNQLAKGSERGGS